MNTIIVRIEGDDHWVAFLESDRSVRGAGKTRNDAVVDLIEKNADAIGFAIEEADPVAA